MVVTKVATSYGGLVELADYASKRIERLYA